MEQAKEWVKNFQKVEITKIAQSTNKEANALSKLASVVFNHLSKKVLVEELRKKSIKQPIIEALEITKEEESWMMLYILFLQKGILPADE